MLIKTSENSESHTQIYIHTHKHTHVHRDANEKNSLIQNFNIKKMNCFKFIHVKPKIKIKFNYTSEKRKDRTTKKFIFFTQNRSCFL